MTTRDFGAGSIQRRIASGFFVTMGLALMLTAGSIFANAFVQFRQGTNENLVALARVTAANVEAALVLDDGEAAAETLEAFSAVDSIEAAIVYGSDGRIFAKYVREDVIGFLPPRELPFEPDWSRERIDLASRIFADEDWIGTVFLRSDTAEAEAFLWTSLGIGGGVLLLSLIVCWGGAARLHRSIALPIERLVRGAEDLSDGDLSSRVDVTSGDEVGALAHVFNAMVDRLRGLVSEVGRHTRSVGTALGKLTAASAAMGEEVQRQEEAVESTAESVGSIISSMHTVTANVEALSETAVETSSAAFEMDSSIAEAATHIDELSEIIDTTASSVVEMTSGIGEIARSAETLDLSTESTAEALSLLSDSVRGVQSNATESHQLSEHTQTKAQQGMSAVYETVEGMTEIQESFKGIDEIIQSLSEKSDSIGAVIKVIESVVEQTNLLALNAAIISSQAGEHGRAFSVVAEEVRSLAERTAASTREIAELIESVQDGVQNAVTAMYQGSERVERGVELSSEAGRILREIGESAQQSTRWAKEIVEATRSQAADIDQVGIAMGQVKETAAQLSRGTHEQDGASSEITRGVEQMRHLGLEVKNAAQEQRRESGLITQSVEIVAARIKEISVETKDQSERADEIREALDVFREVTLQTTRRAQETADTVGDLADHAEGLEREIGRFRI